MVYSFFCLCLVDPMVPPSIGGGKGSGREGVRVKKYLTDAEEIIACEGGVIDVVLASRHGGAIEHNNLCGVLSDCQQDVRFGVLAMLSLPTLLLNFLFLIISVIGNEIERLLKPSSLKIVVIHSVAASWSLKKTKMHCNELWIVALRITI
jgi:hypothetical protein